MTTLSAELQINANHPVAQILEAMRESSRGSIEKGSRLAPDSALNAELEGF